MKKSITDDIVKLAQARYPEIQQSVAAYLAPSGTGLGISDKKLVTMPPEQLAQLDPVTAKQAARRIHQLDVKAASTPYDDTFEP